MSWCAPMVIRHAIQPSEQDLIIQKKGYRVETPCAGCRNTSTLHQMLLQRRLLYEGIPPTPNVPQWSFHGIHFSQ